jgi:hypothetical protein
MRRSQSLLSALHDAGQVNVDRKALIGKNFQSTPVPQANNRRTNRPVGLNQTFTLCAFAAKTGKLGIPIAPNGA